MNSFMAPSTERAIMGPLCLPVSGKRRPVDLSRDVGVLVDRYCPTLSGKKKSNTNKHRFQLLRVNYQSIPKFDQVAIEAGMNALSRREEETLLKATKARALKQCEEFVKGMYPLSRSNPPKILLTICISTSVCAM